WPVVPGCPQWWLDQTEEEASLAGYSVRHPCPLVGPPEVSLFHPAPSHPSGAICLACLRKRDGDPCRRLQPSPVSAPCARRPSDFTLSPTPHNVDNSLLPSRVFQGNRPVVVWEPVDQELLFSHLGLAGGEHVRSGNKEKSLSGVKNTKLALADNIFVSLQSLWHSSGRAQCSVDN
ncbi:hypothetical protein CORC01_13602, partial [Colletotrichum orchidophilum]